MSDCGDAVGTFQTLDDCSCTINENDNDNNHCHDHTSVDFPQHDPDVATDYYHQFQEYHNTGSSSVSPGWKFECCCWLFCFVSILILSFAIYGIKSLFRWLIRFNYLLQRLL